MARDPGRIPLILATLREVWERNPDLRLGQMVMNVCPAGDHSNDCHVYYMEDDELLRCICRAHGGDPCPT